jgi:micrococcal nuclease
MQKEKVILAGLIFLLFIINYSFLDSLLVNSFENKGDLEGIVERVIDGDTIVINGTHIRLLGINTPEKGEKYSVEAKNFLEEKILNKSVKIFFGRYKYDKYKRTLGYVFLDNENINLKIIEEGYANFYFPSGKDKYYNSFYSAWKKCLEKEINLCKKSNLSFAKCIKVEKWGKEFEGIILKNQCNFKVDLSGWSIKDEGRKKFVFIDENLKPYQKIILTPKDWNKEYIWTKTGDSIFVRDNFGNIVFFDSY